MCPGRDRTRAFTWPAGQDKIAFRQRHILATRSTTFFSFLSIFVPLFPAFWPAVAQGGSRHRHPERHILRRLRETTDTANRYPRRYGTRRSHIDGEGRNSRESGSGTFLSDTGCDKYRFETTRNVHEVRAMSCTSHRVFRKIIRLLGTMFEAINWWT
jgi:hypothetical protein